MGFNLSHNNTNGYCKTVQLPVTPCHHNVDEWIVSDRRFGHNHWDPVGEEIMKSVKCYWRSYFVASYGVTQSGMYGGSAKADQKDTPV